MGQIGNKRLGASEFTGRSKGLWDSSSSIKTNSKALKALAHVKTEEVQITCRERSDNIAQVIFEYFRDAINAGTLKRGARLPAQRKLTKQFGVARSTVRKALAMLESQSLIMQRMGSGSYVTAGAGLEGYHSDGRVVAVSPQDVIEALLAIEPGFAEFVVVRATDQEFALMED